VQDARRGEIALWATSGHREVRAEQGVAHCGGDVDRHGRWRSGLYSCAHPFFLPPPRGAADAQNSQPMPGHDALLCACGAGA
jgi:hypothetical protein